MKTRMCLECLKVLPVSSFGRWRRGTKEFIPPRCSSCSIEHRKEVKSKVRRGIHVPQRPRHINGLKVCCSCGEVKPISQFDKRGRNKSHNDKYRDSPVSDCQICVKAKRKKKYNENLEQSRKRSRDWVRNHKDVAAKRAKDFLKTWEGRIYSWRCGAKRRNLSWNLTKEELTSLPFICFWTGVPLTLTQHKNNTVSLDRLDSKKGYFLENVVLCCANVNKARWDMTPEEFISMCAVISRRFPRGYIKTIDKRKK